MLNYHDLKEDIRLQNGSSFVKKIISTYHLSDSQIQQLNAPVNIPISKDKVQDVLDFILDAKRVMICGDYDADGVCATTIAYRLMQKLNKEKIGYYIPHRFKEGYGVSKNTIKLAYEKGYTDILIVDTGVKEKETVDYALSLGLRVAIVDHHLIETDLPNVPLLHPFYLDSYFQNMSAAGLMFVLAESLNLLDQKILAYGMLATIADVMPLWGKNREIVMRGLNSINEKPLPNIDFLWKRYNNPYTTKTIAFQIVPKINAVGRMADEVNMNTMVHYLLSDDPVSIQHYAKQVIAINESRKNQGAEDFKKAKKLLTREKIQVVVDASFHEGIMGIVANQIVSTKNQPAIVFKEMETIYKGSARSNTISLNALFSSLDPHYFEAFGGHDFAFGLSVKKEYFQAFYQDVLKNVENLKGISKKRAAIYCDFEITAQMWHDLSELEPYGEGFESTRFALGDFKISHISKLGNYGYKIHFEDFWLKDAVLFNPSVNPDEIMRFKFVIGTLDYHERFGMSFSIDEFVV